LRNTNAFNKFIDLCSKLNFIPTLANWNKKEPFIENIAIKGYTFRQPCFHKKIRHRCVEIH